MPTVKFINENKSIDVPVGANLREEALKAGVQVYRWRHKFSFANCHGHGTCGTCRVLIRKGMANTNPLTTAEKLHKAVSMVWVGYEDQMRLSCQTQVLGDIEVETRPPLNISGEQFW